MDDQVNRLIQKTWEKYQSLPKSQRLMIAIAGIPGSGKTTLATKLVSALNTLHARSSPGASHATSIATHIPMDGYHLPRAILSTLPDPTTAHARRGAPFTFDAAAFRTLVSRLRSPIAPETKTITAPSFDHAVGDPVADEICIAPSTRVCVFEGNYVALDREPWRSAAADMDEVWFVEVEWEVARRRLVERHLEAGIVMSRDEAEKRVRENDEVNGRCIVDEKLDVVEVVWSREDEGWKEGAEGVKGMEGQGVAA